MRDIEVPRYVEAAAAAGSSEPSPSPPRGEGIRSPAPSPFRGDGWGEGPPLFAHLTAEELFGYGVPLDWLEEVRAVTEDGLFDVYIVSTSGTEPPAKLVDGQDNTAFESLRILSPGLAWDPEGERLAVRIHAYGRACHPTQIARLLGVQMREVYRALAGDPVLASTRAAIDSKL